MYVRRQALGSIGKLGALGAVVALLATLIGSRSVESAAPKPTGELPWPTLPVKDIRPGMVGYGLTVFSGQKPERFPIRVVGVLPKHASLMDIILVDTDEPRLKHSGIVAGMSGSPIYIDGKLVGALSLGWAFSKDALGGVTPIEYMAADLKRPLRGRDFNHLAMDTRSSDALQSPLAELHKRLPASPLGGSLQTGQLQRVAMPLLVSGLSDTPLAMLRDALSPYGMAVMSGGGSAVQPGAPRSFEPGSAIAVDLVRGDVTMQSIGTVTAIDGQRVLAFGHPMLNAGETYFPVSTAEITTFMPSLVSSFKFGHSLLPAGALIQDRSAGIIADTTQPAQTLPLSISIVPVGQPTKVLKMELARHKLLTPVLVSVVAVQAVSVAASDVADVTVKVDSTLKVTGYPPLRQTDYLFSSDGYSGKMLANSTGSRQLQELLSNPFGPVHIESLDMQVELLYRSHVADVVSLALPSDELEPGTVVPIRVAVRPFGQALEYVTLPVEIPQALAGQTVKLDVQAGSQVKPEIAAPDSLSDFVENLRKGYSGKSLVATITTSDEGANLRGRIVPSLPGSVLATLRPGASSRRGEVQKRIYRTVHDVGWVMQGKQELTVQIKDFRDSHRGVNTPGQP